MSLTINFHMILADHPSCKMPKGNTGHQGATSSQYPDHTDAASPTFVEKTLREIFCLTATLTNNLFIPCRKKYKIIHNV